MTPGFPRERFWVPRPWLFQPPTSRDRSAGGAIGVVSRKINFPPARFMRPPSWAERRAQAPVFTILNRRRNGAMFARTLDHFAQVAAEKAAFARDSPGAFLVSSMMAGAYVGIGIILIFTLGQQVEPALRSLVMGSCFGIALTLVVFAGSDLFTGHTMFMTIGVARGSCDLAALARTWVLSWVGNLIGSGLLAAIFWLGGGGQILNEGADLIFAASAAKMNAPAVALIARGALCNWLVCLALWTSARASSDGAKCILIWWCLFGSSPPDSSIPSPT
jgi:nitrite transporter